MSSKYKYINEKSNKEIEKVIRNSKLFDKKYYRKNNPDLGLFYKLYPHIHYALFGYKENRDPSKYFSTSFYYEVCPDVKDAGTNPLYHYEKWGLNEKRILRKHERIITNTITEKKSVNDNYKIKDRSFRSMVDMLSLFGAEIYCQEKILSLKNKKAVLLFSHEMSMTGAPIALKKMADSLSELGYFPVIFSAVNGPESRECEKNDIPVIIYKDINENNIIDNYFDLFDFFVINTQSYFSNAFMLKLNGTSYPVLWWIHEAKASYYDTVLHQLPEYLNPNIHIYCVSDYSKEVMLSHFPHYKNNQLKYFIDDAEFKPHKCKDNEKKQLLLSGTLEPRKGHKVLFDALRLLSDEDRNKLTVSLVGLNAYPDVYKNYQEIEKDYPGLIKYKGLLKSTEMKELYDSSDCLVCASLDDPLPIVVTEAWRNGLFTICSENIGQKHLIEQYNCGLLYKNDSPEQLALCISDYVNDRIDVSEMVKNGREVFDKYFTKEVFKNNISDIIRLIKEHKNPSVSVSVIIPTYNGGQQLVNLITSLRSQKKADIEIICVNSGSKDDIGIKTAEENNCVIINIDKKDFSHSYARNLGAEHAKNELIVFMTQDALPENDMFMNTFANTFIESDTDAASCWEFPYEDHDLYGKLESINHIIQYLGYGKNNKINYFPKDNNYDFNQKRKLCNLSDVCCITKKSVFNTIKYTGNYAEDLRYGYTLLEKGKIVCFISSSKVYHSHERGQKYIFDRAIVDHINLEIFKKEIKEKEDEMYNIDVQQIINLISSYTAAVLLLISRFMEDKIIIYDMDSYCKVIKNEIKAVDEKMKKAEKLSSLIESEKEYLDKDVFRLLGETIKLSDNITTDVLTDIQNDLIKNIILFHNFYNQKFNEKCLIEIETYLKKKCCCFCGELFSYFYYFESTSDKYDLFVQYAHSIVDGKSI